MTFQTLGVLVPDLMGVYVGPLVAALYRRARRSEASVLVVRTRNLDAHYDFDFALEHVDAWVVVLSAASPALLQRIQNRGRPICVIGHDYHLQNIGIVKIDNYAGIALAMRHLHDKGHRNFAYIGPPHMDDCIERKDAVIRFTEENPDCAIPLIEYTPDYSIGAAKEALGSLLNSRASFSAIVAATDNNAFAVIEALRERGLRVPEDVAVVGFDNSMIARTADDGITTLDQNFYALAEAAFADVLLRSAKPDMPACDVRLSPSLIARESTGCKEACGSPRLVELANFAQDFVTASEDVRRFIHTGRDKYIEDYLWRLRLCLRFACVARWSETEQALLLSTTQAGGHVIDGAHAGNRVLPAEFPPYPEIIPSPLAGDCVVLILQEGLSSGPDVISLCFHGKYLADILAIETITHEIELLVYELDLQMMRDELQQTLSKLRSTQEELVRAEKHAALGIAIAGIAHEMNTPLGNCLLAASTLNESTRDIRHAFSQGSIRRTEVDDYFSKVEAAGQMLSRNIGSAIRLIDDFKSIRGDHLISKPERLKLSIIIENAITSLKEKRRSGIAIIVKIDERILVTTQTLLLEKVLIELIENALVHGLSETEDGIIEISADARNGKCYLCISDNGKGLPPDSLERVFDPFYTTNMGASSGLGLTMVHNLVSGYLHGKVWAEFCNAGGAQFVIEIPL